MKMIVIAVSLLGLIHTTGRCAAEVPAAVSSAAEKLRAAPNYSWTTTTEMPGAPFLVSPVTGTADKNGLAVLKSEAGKKVVAAKGERRVLNTSAGWKTAAELGDVNDPAGKKLMGAQTPPDELIALAVKLREIKPAGDDSLVGTLDAEAAKAHLLSSMKGRAPGGMTPKVETTTGRFQIWLKDGLPHKYILTIDAKISLPFGSKEVKRISTTEIKNIGSTNVELPTKAMTALER